MVQRRGAWLGQQTRLLETEAGDLVVLQLGSLAIAVDGEGDRGRRRGRRQVIHEIGVHLDWLGARGSHDGAGDILREGCESFVGDGRSHRDRSVGG